MRTRFTQNLGRFQNWVMAALPPCQKARMQKAKMAAAALSTRGALGYWVSLNSWIVILARLFCVAREESLNQGPFARQPPARVTENSSSPVFIAESDPQPALGGARHHACLRRGWFYS
jgi:hypothetical protein